MEHLELARKTFRPEFLNRIDEYMVSQPLDREEIGQIVKLQMDRVKGRIKQKNIDLHYTEEAVNLLATLGYDPSFGARPVKRLIQQLIEDEVAMGILGGDFKEDDSIIVKVHTYFENNDDLLLQNMLIVKKMDYPLYRLF